MATLNSMNVVKANVKLPYLSLNFLGGMMLFLGCSMSLAPVAHSFQQLERLLDWLGIGVLLIALSMTIGLMIFGLWIGRTGIEALSQKCYPPCHSQLMCDTLLVTGWRATVKALSACMLSAIAILGTFSLSLEIIALINL